MACVTLTEQTFTMGKNRFRVSSNGDWSALMFGWWPTGNNPRWQWSPIEVSSVPDEVKKAARR